MTTHKLAVLGDPIEHSLSPVMHRAALQSAGLDDWSYEAIRVSSGGLAKFLASRDDSWRGFSLTMPLKREAESDRSAAAKLVGNVNTLVRHEHVHLGGHQWTGDNTDYPGAVAALRERVVTPIHSAAILGGGATAASTGLALADMGADEIELLVRNPATAEESRRVIESHPLKPRVTIGSLDERPSVDALVSTIPGRAQTPELVAEWHNVAVLFDVVYDPWPTPFMSSAVGVVVSGIDLLAHQAALQFKIFTGHDASASEMRNAAINALEHRA